MDILFTDEVVKFLISGEDHRFQYHFGFDIIAILRAIKNRYLHDKIEGASTIEQQLVRVLTNNYEPTIKRKIKEIFLSTTISDTIPKSDIPLFYLSVAYYGSNMQGLQQAVDKLQNKTHDFTLLAAELVARLKYPEPLALSPLRENQIKKRKAHLLYLYNKHRLSKWIKIHG